MSNSSSKTKGDGSPSDADRSEPQPRVSNSEPESSNWWPHLDARWFLYPAYATAFVGAGLAANFAAASPEWSAVPVLLGWGLLFVWYWLYGVGFRYRRPALKYLSLATAVGFGGFLAAVCIDRALPQLAATRDNVAVRGASLTLVWAAIVTGLGVAAIAMHAVLFSRSRES